MTRAEWALLPTPEVLTLNAAGTDADLARANGWEPGTHLAGDNPLGVMVLRITAIGEEHVLARVVSVAGQPPKHWPFEACRNLRDRDWRKVPQA